MAITKITSNVLASNAAQDNLNAGSVIVFTKPLSATTVQGSVSASGNIIGAKLGAGIVPTQLIHSYSASDSETGIRAQVGGSWIDIRGNNGSGQPGIRTSGGLLDLGQVIVGGHGGGGTALRVRQNGTVGSTETIQSWINSSNTTVMTVNSAGNVGIGTSTPTTKLEITTAGSADGIKLKRSDDERVAWLVDEGSGSGALYLFNGANSNSVFITGNGNSFLNGGNVGIGTGTPTAKLNILDTTLAGSAGLSGSALNIAQTWNTNLTPTALSVNVTDLSSNAASLLMDLRVGGTSEFKVSKGGSIFSRAAIGTNSGSPGADGLSLEMFYAGYGIGTNSNGDAVFYQNNTARTRVGFGVAIANNQSLGFTNATHVGGDASVDTIIRRDDAANTLAQRNGLNPQEFRLYNKFNNASDYERFFIKTNVGATSATQIGLSAAGTGENRNLEFVVGGSTRMTIASGGNITVSGTLTLGAGGTIIYSASGLRSAPTLAFNSTPSGYVRATAYGFADSGFFAGIGDVGFSGNTKIAAASTYGIGWGSAATIATGSIDTALYRASAGVVEINNGTLGQLRDGSLRNLTASGNISAAGDIEITDFTKGIILRSPNSSRWRVIVTDTGALSTTAI